MRLDDQIIHAAVVLRPTTGEISNDLFELGDRGRINLCFPDEYCWIRHNGGDRLSILARCSVEAIEPGVNGRSYFPLNLMLKIGLLGERGSRNKS